MINPTFLQKKFYLHFSDTISFSSDIQFVGGKNTRNKSLSFLIPELPADNIGVAQIPHVVTDRTPAAIHHDLHTALVGARATHKLDLARSCTWRGKKDDRFQIYDFPN